MKNYKLPIIFWSVFILLFGLMLLAAESVSGYIYTFILVLLIWSLLFFWIHQLIVCVKERRPNKIAWFFFILIFNFIGAAYYFRLTQKTPSDPEAFEKEINNWLSKNNFSLKKAKGSLAKVALFGASLIPFYFIAWAVELFCDITHTNIPSWMDKATGVALFLFLIYMFKKLITFWKEDKTLALFLVRPILQAKAGNRGEEMVLAERKNDPMRNAPVANLIMGDFFLLMGLLLPMIIFSPDPKTNLESIILMPVFGLMFFFIGFKTNVNVIFYNRPSLVFSLINHYKFWKAMSYGIPILLMLGILSALYIDIYAA